MLAAALGVTAGVAMGAVIDGPPPQRVSAHDASSMLEKGKRNKNGTKDIGIQAFDAILQLGVTGLSVDSLTFVMRRVGAEHMPHSPSS